MAENTEEEKENTTELLIWEIDPEVKKKFKAKCVEKDISMRDAVINFMAEFNG